MAEVLGIVGACFNICQILSQAVKRSIELYEAPADILELEARHDSLPNLRIVTESLKGAAQPVSNCHQDD